jgi:transcriptional regulator with XRE-family HTH domain
MSDDIYPGGPVMIKIDGTKIRRIREQKGLTQLYIATAVDVTTDTVSRWENKRYPSIKKENGLKLALALEVILEEILDSTTEAGPDTRAAQQTVQDNSTNTEPSVSAPQASRPATRSLSFKTGFLITLMFIPLFGVMVYYIYFQEDTTLPQISVRRTVPPNFIAGQPLPVFIHISSSSENPLSFILRENLPPGTAVLSAYPEVSEKHKKNNSIQWLDNISNSALFIYTISTSEDFSGTILFDGQLKVSSSNKFEIEVSGDQNSTSGLFHWADKDQDNKISDEEILTIYDLTNTNQYAEIDMDLLEEIWLGDGYIWQPSKQQFSILE